MEGRLGAALWTWSEWWDLCKKRMNTQKGRAPKEVAGSGDGWGVVLLRERPAALEEKIKCNLAPVLHWRPRCFLNQAPKVDPLNSQAPSGPGLDYSLKPLSRSSHWTSRHTEIHRWNPGRSVQSPKLGSFQDLGKIESKQIHVSIPERPVRKVQALPSNPSSMPTGRLRHTLPVSGLGLLFCRRGQWYCHSLGCCEDHTKEMNEELGTMPGMLRAIVRFLVLLLSLLITLGTAWRDVIRVNRSSLEVGIILHSSLYLPGPIPGSGLEEVHSNDG